MAGNVVFPSDLPQWQAVRAHVLQLPQCRSLSSLIRQLSDLHCLVHQGAYPQCPEQKGSLAFRGLDRFFYQQASAEEQATFLYSTLPCVCHWAVQIEDLKPHEGISIWPAQQGGSLTLSRCLVASIISCGVLCLFPGRKAEKASLMSPINFDSFYPHLGNPAQCSKWRCILHYFERLAECPDGFPGNITVSRRVLHPVPTLESWFIERQPLCNLSIFHTGIIADAGPEVVKVNFASKKIGGGVLGTGRVQEEICVCSHPELLSCQLFMSAMEDNEAIWCEGHEAFSVTHGYATTLKFVGDFKDPTPVDAQGNLMSMLVSMNALQRAAQRQHQDENILRELNKALAAFDVSRDSVPEKSNCVEGNFVSPITSNPYGIGHMRQEFGYHEHSFSLISDSDDGAWGPVESIEGGACGGLDSLECPESASAMRFAMDDSISDDGAMAVPVLDHAVPMLDQLEVLQGVRRRSSNLSDLASRRSSSSTKNSSDISSEFEEFYETFQKEHKLKHAKHAAIKEELNPGVQEFANSLVKNLLREGSNTAAQMMPGVQQFGASQPVDVAKPRPVRLAPSVEQDQEDLHTVSPGSSPNQTDDEKARSSMSTYVDAMVLGALAEAQQHFSAVPSSIVSRHSGYGGGLHYLGSPLASPSYTLRSSAPPRTGFGNSVAAFQGSHTMHVLGTPPIESSENEDPSSEISGESLTDDLKEAAAALHTRGAAETVATAVVNSIFGANVSSRDRFHHSVVAGASLASDDCKLSLHTYADTITSSVMVDAITEARRPCLPRGSGSIGSRGRRPPVIHTSQQEDNPLVEFAEDLVRGVIQSAVHEVFGYRDFQVFFTHPRPIPSPDSKYFRKEFEGKTSRGSRKGSVEEEISMFSNNMRRRHSEDHIPKPRNRSSSGFKDVTLSTFADELIRSNPNSPSFTMFDAGWRGSMDHSSMRSSESSTSSCGRSSREKWRRASYDVVLGSTFARPNQARRGSAPPTMAISRHINDPWLQPVSHDMALELVSSRRADAIRQTRKRQMESHLEWFVQDLLVDSFTDAFICLYGKLCQNESSDCGAEGPARVSRKLINYVDNFVETVFQEALAICEVTDNPPPAKNPSPHIHPSCSLRKMNSDYSVGSEDTESSVYTDALDIPFPCLEVLAEDMASTIMGDSIEEAVETEVLRKAHPMPRPIATGNWGCGAYRGDPQLKAMIQWIAASRAQTPELMYYTFGNEHMAQFEAVRDQILHMGWNCGELLQHIVTYCHHRHHSDFSQSLFDYLMQC